MARTTPNYQIPYPELTDKPDGATQMQALATQVDTKLKPIDDLANSNEGRLTALEASVMVQVVQTVSQSIPSAAFTPLIFDIEDFDSDNMWTSSNPSRITCTKAGVYLITGGLCFAANATGRRGAYWYKSNVIINNAQSLYATGVNGQAVNPAAATLLTRMVVGDYLELRAYQDSGSSLVTGVGGGSRPYITALRVAL